VAARMCPLLFAGLATTYGPYANADLFHTL